MVVEVQIHLPRSRVRRARMRYNLILSKFQVAIMHSSPVVLNRTLYHWDQRTLYHWDQRSNPIIHFWFLWKRFLFSKIHCICRQQFESFDPVPESEHGTHRLSCNALSHYTTIHVPYIKIESISTKKLLFENLIIALQKSPLICFWRHSWFAPDSSKLSSAHL